MATGLHCTPPACGVQLGATVAQFLQIKSLTLAAGTLGEYENRLNRWLEWHKPAHGDQLGAVTVETLRGFFLHLADAAPYTAGNNTRKPRQGKRLTPSYIDSIWRTLRTFWFWCEAEGYLSDEQCLFFRNNRIPRPRVPEQIRPIYEDEAIKRLADACETHLQRAILYLLLESGMRLSEMLSMRYENLHLRKRQARIRGKGGRWRYVFWGPMAQEPFLRYLMERGDQPGPVFDMDGDQVRRVLYYLGELAGVELPEGATVHALRHTFAHTALDAGVDALHLAQLLGHSNIETTLRYSREHPERLRNVHNRIFRTRQP